MWTGSRALELGLVDQLGGLDTAIDLAAQKAGIEDVRVSYREPVLDEFDVMLASLMADDDNPVIEIPTLINQLLSQVPQSLLEPGIKARLPFNLNF